MTLEDKKLILQDLCARLPYGVQILYDSDKKFDDGLICQPYGLTIYNGRTCALAFGVVDPIEIDELKLYLRPMSSMTKEELYEYSCFVFKEYDGYLNDDTPDFTGNHYVYIEDVDIFIDWLNAHHFDYRGLIEKGLALKAPEGMYDN